MKAYDDRLPDLLAGLDEPSRRALENDPALFGALVDCVERGAAAWPELSIPPSRFAAYVLERLENPSAEAVEAMHAEDLHLACACVEGVSQAIATFERIHAAELDSALRRLERRGLQRDDLRQALREKLFTGSVPKIGDYKGQGKLRNWVRVTILRLRIDAERRRDVRPDKLSDYSRPPSVPDVGDDPELAHMKAHYRDAFQEALGIAFSNLEARERILLRQRLDDGLTLDQLAALHRVHKATVKRWIAAARRSVLRETQRRMSERLGIGRQELDSVMRMVESNLEVSILRHLQSGSA